MKKILTVEEAAIIAEEIRKNNESIILVGGCFDILHIGHLTFLENAKKQGDTLFVLLESDANIKKLKGKNRPINTQEDRASLLEALEIVTYVVLLPDLITNDQYDEIITRIKPSIIAITKGDSSIHHKERQAKKVNGIVVIVTEIIKDQSTTRLAELISKDL
ncbi:MAG: adenylyltransferase/cytidyltransferase family protein [Candidatus Levybacteria bacterium]|nr:adenylyltransferase/cytidyltransferase family protein [Candidatus Levybacteria bacterium]